MPRKILALAVLPLLLLSITIAQAQNEADCETTEFRDICYSLKAKSQESPEVCEYINDRNARAACVESASARTAQKYPFLIGALVMSLVAAILFAAYIVRKKSNAKARIGRIADYITKWKANGYDDSAITDALKDRGFSNDEIGRAYSRISGTERR